MDLIIRKCNSFFGHVVRLVDDAWLIKPFSARLTSLLDGFLTVLGNVPLATQEASGWIRLALVLCSFMKPALAGE